MKKLILLLPLFVICSLAASGRDYGQFNQGVDVTKYRGGQFKLTAFVKVGLTNPKICQARLWARIDKEKGMGFFDNMYNRPITSKEWAEYTIEGPIDDSAVKLIVGGLYFGFGKYYFDNFNLKLKTKNGEWEAYNVPNGGFEDESINQWHIEKSNGFSSNLTAENASEGKQSLLIDGSVQIKNGNFININGIDFFYRTSGKGDTVLLLHGNMESSKSFDKQIPEFSKNFFVIALDSRGQGYSSDDGQKITYDLMADDVNQLLEKIKVRKVNILGWSDGGNTGLILAMKHPEKVKRLATMGANLYNDKTSVEDKLNKQIVTLRESLIKQKIAPSDIRIRMADLLMNEPKINPEDLKLISCPTMVIAGEKDVIKENHTKLIASKIPRSKLVILNKSTHLAPQEIPERFNKTVIDFFKEN